jgi:hypothetical protein
MAADASFKTAIDSMSSGFNLLISPPAIPSITVKTLFEPRVPFHESIFG